MTKPSKESVDQTIKTVKTVVIAVLIAAIVAFVGGMHYQSRNNAQTQSAVSQAVAKK